MFIYTCLTAHLTPLKSLPPTISTSLPTNSSVRSKNRFCKLKLPVAEQLLGCGSVNKVLETLVEFLAAKKGKAQEA